MQNVMNDSMGKPIKNETCRTQDRRTKEILLWKHNHNMDDTHVVRVSVPGLVHYTINYYYYYYGTDVSNLLKGHVCVEKE